MARTLGLDLSTCIGAAVAGDGCEQGRTIMVPNLKGMQRLQLLAEEVERVVAVWNPALVVLEGYAYTKNISSFVTLVEIGTVVRGVLYRMEMEWFVVPPTVLKKWTTGKGNANKDDMAVAVLKRWGYMSHSNDIVDAFALAQMGQLGRDMLLAIPGVISGH